MFYCDKCAYEASWPETAFKSHGTCEMCGKTAVCNDKASKELPRPVPNEDEPECGMILLPILIFLAGAGCIILPNL